MSCKNLWQRVVNFLRGQTHLSGAQAAGAARCSKCDRPLTKAGQCPIGHRQSPLSAAAVASIALARQAVATRRFLPPPDFAAGPPSQWRRDFQEAWLEYRVALEQQPGNPQGPAHDYAHLQRLLTQDPDQAATFLEQAITHYRGHSDWAGLEIAHLQLFRVYRFQGREPLAHIHHAQAMSYAAEQAMQADNVPEVRARLQDAAQDWEQFLRLPAAMTQPPPTPGGATTAHERVVSGSAHDELKVFRAWRMAGIDTRALLSHARAMGLSAELPFWSGSGGLLGEAPHRAEDALQDLRQLLELLPTTSSP